MDLLRLAIRCVAVYALLLSLIRLSGKSTVSQATTMDFVVCLILGDLVDDAVWGEVPFGQFVVAAATIILTKLALALKRVS